MAKVASEGKSWKEAFLSTLPPRKGAKGIDGGDNDDDDDEDNSSQDDDSKSAADVDVKTVTTVANSSETEKVVDDNEADKLERDKETKL